MKRSANERSAHRISATLSSSKAANRNKMPKLTIYQKPTCSTCRTVMTRLKEVGIDYDSIDYIIEPPSREKLAELARKMNASPRTLLRTREPEYEQLNLADASF